MAPQSIDASKFNTLISSIAMRFINLPLEEIDAGIKGALEEIGLMTLADGVILFLFSDDGRTARPYAEWLGGGLQSTLGPRVALDPIAHGRITDRLMAGEVITIESFYQLEHDLAGAADQWISLGIASGISVPLSRGNDIIGFLAIAYTKESGPWSDDVTELLSIAAEILSNLLNRRQTEEELRRSEKHRQLALEAGRVVTWELDIETQELSWLDDVSMVFEETERGFISNLSEFFDLIHPDDVANVRLIYSRTLELGESFDLQYRIIRTDGDERWVSLRGTPQLGESDHVRRILGTVTDITDRRNAEIKLEFRMDFEKLITSISTRFINLPVERIDEGINQALREVAEFAGMNQTYVFLFEDDGKVSCRYEWCDDAFEPQIDYLQQIDLNAAFPWYAERLGTLQTVSIPNVAELPPEAAAFKGELEREGIESLVDVPMVSAGRLVGFLGFASIHKEMDTGSELVPVFRIMGEIIVNSLERLSKEEELRQSDQDRRQAQRLARIGSWTWDIDADAIHWTNEVHEFLDIPRQTTGLSMEEFTELIHPDDRAGLSAAVNRATSNGEPLDEEIRVTFVGGLERTIHETGQVVMDENQHPIRMVGTVQDITDRKESERSVIENEKRFRTLFDSAVDAISIMSDDKFVMCNAIALQVFGCEPFQIIGRSPHEFSPETQPDGRSSKDAADAWISAALAGTPQLFEWKHLRLDGTPFDAEVHLDKIDLPGGTFLQALVRDITEKKRAQELAERQKDQLFRASKMVSLGTLVSGFAHEVNNPNNYIRLNIQGLADFHREIDGILERLHDQDPDLTLMRLPYPRAREIIDGMTEGVLEGSYRIERLIDDLKAFARDQKGDLDQAVDLNEVVESAVKLVNSVIRKTTSHFDCTLSDLPITVRGDGHQIEQVVINLLTNACQALEDRRKAIRISVGANHDGRTAFVEVEDEGVGISEEDIPHIADPFYSTKRKSGGTGLGLSVSYQIIQDHRGELLFDSEVGRGTVATILLPL